MRKKLNAKLIYRQR